MGAEAPLAPLSYGAFALIHAMSARNDAPEAASRPFDRDRDGFVMAEGAAALLFERRDRALARGAHIYGEVLGYALTNDGYHMTAPRPDGSQTAVLPAVSDRLVETNRQLAKSNEALAEMDAKLTAMKGSFDQAAASAASMERELKALPGKVALSDGFFGLLSLLR